MLKAKNIFLIGAADRNVGKTEFACMLIKNCVQTAHKVIGVKVTTVKDDSKGTCPRGGQGCGVCSSLSGNFCITNETDASTSKDTSRMLRAGAQTVYWLRVKEGALQEGASDLIERIKNTHGPNVPVVCESNSLRNVLEPGLFFILNRLNNPNIKNSCNAVEQYADKKVNLISIQEGFDFNPNCILFENNRWYFRTEASCIILAGGKSSRMGEDKTKLKFHELSLLEYLIRQLKPIFSEILISSNKPDDFKYLNFRVIKDLEEGYGPLMGIYSCLKASNTEKNFVIACDIPEPNINLMYKLLGADSSLDVVIPKHENGMIEPLFAVYNKRVIPSIEEVLKTSNQIRSFFHKVKTHYFNSDSNFFNINTSEDYQTFIKWRQNNE